NDMLSELHTETTYELTEALTKRELVSVFDLGFQGCRVIVFDALGNRCAKGLPDRLVVVLGHIRSGHDGAVKAFERLHQRQELDVQPESFRVEHAKRKLTGRCDAIVECEPSREDRPKLDLHCMLGHKKLARVVLHAALRFSQRDKEFAFRVAR